MDQAGNVTTKERVVEIVDTIAPSITVSQSTIILSKGQEFTLPTFSAFDNLDGDLSSNVSVTGAETVDINRVGDYEIKLSVTDSNTNMSELIIVVRVEPPAYAINGHAIDGYLVGAKVIFDADGDGQADLPTISYTEENGEFFPKLFSRRIS